MDDFDTVGFVGLGNMGTPLSNNLLAAGFKVRAYARRSHDAFLAAGGEWVTQVGALADLPVIVLSLPGAQALQETVDGLLPRSRPGQVIIDLSSHPIAVKQAQAQRLAARGTTLLDCEISGLPPQAAARDAIIFQSGDEQAIQRALPVFTAMAKQHCYVGSFGSATRLKLIANTMVCVHNLMAAEALNLGARAGLAPELMLKVLGASAASSTTFQFKAPLMVSRAFEQGKGPFRHMFGYLARAAEMAAQSGASTPLLDAARGVYAQAEAQARHDQDIAAIIELIESATSAPTTGVSS
jgi:3-hydroxyisobutyrate dehydrogenase-like beta-hydroxyacid dehydrogenase